MSAVIFSGDRVKALRAALKLQDQATIFSGAVDPSTVATSGVAGDVYISTSTFKLYVKQDSGSSTNWDELANTMAALTPNKLVITDGSGNIIASSLGTSDLVLASGVNPFIADQSMGGNKLTSLADGTASGDAVNKSQLDAVESLIQNFEWQESVLTRSITPPGGPSTGDRYLLDLTLGTPTGAWTGQGDKIAEWDGVGYVFTTPTLGTFIGVDDEIDALYYYGGSSWSKKYFENTTASTGLVKVGFDIQLDSSSAGSGLGFSSGVLSVNTDGQGLEVSTDQIILELDGSTLSKSASGLKVADGGITDTQVNASAAVDRTKLANGTANHVLINTAGGVMSSEAALAISRGGTNNSSAYTAGSIIFSNGTSLTQDNSTFFFDDTNNRLYVGSNSSGTGKINAVVTSGSDLAINAFSTGSNNAAQIQNQSAFTLALINGGATTAGASIGGLASRGTLASRTQSQSGDTLFSIGGQGYTGTVFGPGYPAAMAFYAAETITASNNGGEIALLTATNGTLTPIERLRIKNDGVVNISNLTASLPVKTNASKDLISAAIDLNSAETTGTLPINKGGTGQTTQTAAFDALSPSTTKGDLIVHNGTDNIRLPVGANGSVLMADSAEVSGLKYATVSIPSTGDLNETSFSGANNEASPVDVTSFMFATGSVRSFQALVSVVVDATSDLYEVFELRGVQRGSDWAMNITSNGDDSLVDFTITNSGQIQYTSGNYSGFSSLTIKFRAITTGV